MRWEYKKSPEPSRNRFNAPMPASRHIRATNPHRPFH
jgi:hypothetical protein